VLVSLLLAALPTLGHGQSLPNVPSLPQQERFLERSDPATLRTAQAEITAGETPQLTLVLTNQGTRDLRAPEATLDHNVFLSAFDTDGNQLRPDISSTVDFWLFPTTVRKLPRVKPGQSREFSLNGGLNPPTLLPAGTYEFRVRYSGGAGSPDLYDVYERGAEDVWEGALAARITVRVRPVDASREQELIEQIRIGDSTSAQSAIRVLGLSRAHAAIGAIVERLSRDESTLPGVLEALGYMATPDAARALANAWAALPRQVQERTWIIDRAAADVTRLVRSTDRTVLREGTHYVGQR
jgi:hypothetical protein